jgi:hypothetical protein
MVAIRSEIHCLNPVPSVPGVDEGFVTAEPFLGVVVVGTDVVVVAGVLDEGDVAGAATGRIVPPAARGFSESSFVAGAGELSDSIQRGSRMSGRGVCGGTSSA